MSGSSKGGVSVIISATDRASQTIDRLNKRLQTLQRPMVQLQRQLTRFGELSGLKRLEQGFQAVASAGLRIFSVMGAILAPMAALTGLATVAGIGRLVKEFAAFSDELLFTSYRLGVVPQQLQALQGAAMLSGASAAGLTAGIETLKTTLTNAVGGFAPDAVLMGRTLGVALVDGKNHALDFAVVMPKLIDRIRDIRDPILRMRAATAFFGSAAADLMPTIMQGSVALARQVEVAKKYGTETDADIAKGRAFNESFAALSISVRSLTNNIGAALAPSLTELSWWMANLILANKEWIRTSIEGEVKRIRDYLASPAWAAWQKHFWNVVDAAEHVVKALGGVWNVAWDLLYLWGGIKAAQTLGFFITMAANVAIVTRAFWGLRTAALAAAAAEAAAAGAGVPAAGGAGLLATLGGWAAAGLGAAGTLLLAGDTPLTDADKARQAKRGGILDNAWRHNMPTWLGGSPKSQAGATAGGIASGQLPPGVEAQVRAAAVSAGLDPNHMVSLARAEGGTGKTSPTGAYGTMQLEPGTAREMGVNAYDMAGNLKGGMAYFKQQLARFGTYAAAEAAYNAGPHNTGMQRFATTGDPSMLPSETAKYIKTIAANDAQYGPAANINGGTGASAGAATIRGSADLNVNFRNAPPGTQVATSTEGDLFSGVKYNTPMPAFGP